MMTRAHRAGLLSIVCLFMAGLVTAAHASPSPVAGGVDFQLCEPQTRGAIGGVVFLDANGDGVRQAAEDGINGVVLSITGPSGVTQTVTSGGVSNIPGQYSTGPTLCDAGTYTVSIVSVPAGYQTSGPATRSVTLTRDPNGVLSKVGNLNFSLVRGICTSSIGDRVWDDLNANGIQDVGEPGISGVVVQLFEGTTLVATTLTDANGNYTFVVPCTRTFRVEVETPAGYIPTLVQQGADRTVDSDGSPAPAVIGENEHRTDIDFGFYALCQGSIGDFVWHDLNRNGRQDAGEPGLAGVTVELVFTDAQGMEQVRTTFTDASGYYLFSSVCPGEYQVRVVLASVPSGFVATLVGQGDTAGDSNPNPSSVVLPAFDSTDLTIDFGFQSPCTGTIGDFVWEDLNTNGIQDAGEPGIAGVEVRLYRQGESMPSQVVYTTASGAYLFTGLCGGDFIVEVNPDTLPGGTPWQASPANQGGDDAADSDGVGHRAEVTLAADATDLTIDFGYFRKGNLVVSKTAAGRYTKTYRWTLTKSVSPSSHSGRAGEVAGSSTWSVAAGLTETEGGYLVTGTISIFNPNTFAVAVSVSDTLNDGTAAAVICPSSSVGAGATLVCTYSASPAGRTATLNTATVSASGFETFTATAPVAFTALVDGDATTTLADARFGYSQSISGNSAPTFPETFACPSDPSKYTNGTHTYSVTNVATLTGPNTNLSADATVRVTCTIERWEGESATGYGIEYPGSANWFMYTPYTTSKVNLVVGRRHVDIGDIFMSRSGGNTTIRIVLHDGWRWADVAGNLKIHAFTSAPTAYLPPGQFRYHFRVSGNTITVVIPGTSARFYGIHGDVEGLVR